MHEVMEPPEGHEGHESNPLVLPVSVTLAILAVMVAMVTLLGHRASTEEIILQGQANDQWAYYQAKNSRSHEMQGVSDILGTFAPVDKETTEKLREKYAKESERYEKEKEQASEKAKDFEKEKELIGRRGDRFDAAEVLLEIALIICSLTLLTKKRIFWMASIGVGILGIVVAVSGFLLG
ncbi:MAG TPA: DUF4337 domain-containing protein [Candidatus Acidoferrum sp.]|jgi:hypothetical protein